MLHQVLIQHNSPVPALRMLNGTHQPSKIRLKGGFEGKICMSAILGKRSLLGQKICENQKKGLLSIPG